MKRSLFSKISKRLAAAAIVGLAFALPATSLAAQTVKLESSLGVANVTDGDTTYKKSVNADYDEVVKMQVYYHNTENPDTGDVAKNLTVKINIPSGAGKSQTVSSKVSADNSNTVKSEATINLSRSDAYLQYIPGSAVWKHNTGTNKDPKYVETKISDAVVNSGSGLRLENEKPCYNFAATVTVLARVMVPGVTVKKQISSNGAWVDSNSAKPGDEIKYMITYKNTGNTTQKNVVIRDSLPVKMTLVPGSTYLYNSNNANGVLYNSDNITRGGIVIGDYKPGAGAYVVFKVKMPTLDQLVCGDTTFTNVGVAKPEGMAEYFDTATTATNKQCVTPGQPTYACTAFDVVAGANRTATVKDYKYTATNGATFKKVVLNWGDGSTPLTTDATNILGQDHQYAADGTYTIIATSYFTVGGREVSVGGCQDVVTFSSTPTTPTTPETPASLVKTGPAETVAIVLGAIVAGTVASRLFLSRRLARQ